MPFLSYLLSGLLLLPFSDARPTIPVAAQLPAEHISWSATRRLTWADFKSKPQPTEQIAALTAATIDAQIGCKDYVFEANVKAVFIPDESWVRDPARASPNLLRHEQLHFDLTELHARMMRQKLSILKFDCEHLQPAFQNLSNATFSAWKRETARYDQETNHSLNVPKQEIWEAQVKQRLALLDKFASKP
jgi:hypothetical protein